MRHRGYNRTGKAVRFPTDTQLCHKASIAATTKSNFIIGAMAHHGKPYDGHTLGTVLQQIARLTGITPEEAHVDLGYRGHDAQKGETRIILARQKRGITTVIRHRQKRRNAIQPIIGHCKNDRKTGPKNWLKGTLGDKINAIAIAEGFNLRKILKWILSPLSSIRLIKQNHPPAQFSPA